MIKKVFLNIFSDSIIKCSQLSKKIRSYEILNKKLKKMKKINFELIYNGINGATTINALENLEKFVLRKKTDIAIFQFGINDSWHYRSLKGLPNVSLKNFQSNLIEIVNKCKKFKIRKIFFLTYHRVAKQRLEINRKTINQNLQKYNSLIRKVVKKVHNVELIDINKDAKDISSKLMCIDEPDGVHLNKLGSEIYADIIFKKLNKSTK